MNLPHHLDGEQLADSNLVHHAFSERWHVPLLEPRYLASVILGMDKKGVVRQGWGIIDIG